MLSRSSVRWRLLLAFLGISSLAVLGGGVAIYSFVGIRDALNQITERRVPSVLTSLRLSRQAERLVAAAPALLAAATLEKHEEQAALIRLESQQLNAILDDLEKGDIDPSVIEPIGSSVRWLTLNLISLETTVGNALAIGDERRALGREALEVNAAIKRALQPAVERLDVHLPGAEGLSRSAGNGEGTRDAGPARSAEVVAAAWPLMRLRAEIAAMGDRLGSVGLVDDRTSLEQLGQEMRRSLGEVGLLAGSLGETLRAPVSELAARLRPYVDGRKSVLRARALEIDARSNARQLLDQSAVASERLTKAVDRLVLSAEQDIRRAGGLARRQQRISTGVLVAVVVLSLASSALIVWLYVDRSLVRRLTSLSDSMLSIAQGDLRTPIPTGGSDEIARMADALFVFRAATTERAAAERARANLSRYFSPNLANHLAEHPDTLELGGERRELTFLFTDLAGFTPLVERLDPTLVVSVMNEYVGGIAGIVFEHGGTVDTVVGDAVHAIFGAPMVQEDHARQAVSAALAIDRFSREFAGRQAEQGVPVGMTRVGVHTGSAIVGNFGGGTFFHYTAHGDAVNTAARLETANKALGTRLCVSGETASLIPDFKGRPVGELVLRGKASEIGAFEPVDAEEAGSERLDAYLAAFEMLEERDPGCLQAFASYVGEYGNEPLASFHLKRLLAGQISTRIDLDGDG